MALGKRPRPVPYALEKRLVTDARRHPGEPVPSARQAPENAPHRRGAIRRLRFTAPESRETRSKIVETDTLSMTETLHLKKITPKNRRDLGLGRNQIVLQPLLIGRTC